MKSVFVALFAVVSVASAQRFFFSDAPTAPAGVPAQLQPQQQFFGAAQQPLQQRYVPIVEHTQVKNQDGSYNLRYETANGIAQQENSQVALNAKGEAVLHKSGSYGYTAPDGTPVSISYIADEHGFRVNGSPLPVAPAPVQAAAPVANFF